MVRAMTRDEALARLRAALPDLRERYGIVRLGLFGSVARNEARVDSDVDLVAEFAPGARAGVFELFAMERQLSRMLGCRTTITGLARANAVLRASIERDLVHVE